MLRQLGIALFFALLLAGCKLFTEETPARTCPECTSPDRIPDPPRLAGPRQILAGECVAYSLDLSSRGPALFGITEARSYRFEDEEYRDITIGAVFEDSSCLVPIETPIPAGQSSVRTIYLKRNRSGLVRTEDGYQIDVFDGVTPRASLEWKSERWGSGPYRARGCSQDAGDASMITLTVTNKGNALATGFYPHPVPADREFPSQAVFVNLNCPGTLDPGKSCELRIYFEERAIVGLASGLMSLAYMTEGHVEQAPLIFELETMDCSER